MKQLLGRMNIAWQLIFVCVACELVIPERLGVRLCMVQCLRYNRCFGVKMNVARMSCTLLNNRHTDGNTLDFSRNSILQTMQTGRTCTASKHYKRLFCLLNTKGHSVDITDHTAPPEDTINRVAFTFKKTSLHNCRYEVRCFDIIPDFAYSQHHTNKTFVGTLERDILPGTRHLINMYPVFVPRSSDVADNIKLYTVAVMDTSSVNFNRMGWNITYAYDVTSGKYEAEYNSFNRSRVKKNITQLGFFMLLDRSSAGDVLLDIDSKTNTVQGSALGPNLNQTMWVVIRLYLPANVKLYMPHAPLRDLEKTLHGWYEKQAI